MKLKSSILLLSLTLLLAIIIWGTWGVGGGINAKPIGAPKYTGAPISATDKPKLIARTDQAIAKNPPDKSPDSILLNSNGDKNLAELFAQSDNYRDFIAYAMQHPEKGGYFYVNELSMYCMLVGSWTSPTAKIDATASPASLQRRQHDYDKAKRSCEGVIVKEHRGSSFEYLKDPGIDLLHHQHAASVAEIENMYKRAFETNDPSIVTAGIMGSADTVGYYFDGKLYTRVSGDASVINAAAALFPCLAGLDCNKPFFANKGHCIEDDGFCAQSYETRMLADLNDTQIKKARELANAIAQAYRDKNPKPFMRK